MTEDRKRWVGQVINGQFELRQYLGGSESAAVFLTDRGERGLQTAALKIIAADQRRAERQLSRWAAAAKFSNPHLLRIFESGRCRLDQSDFVYVVMEYAEEDLSQILPTRPLTPAETRDMLVPTLDALAYLHAKGFVHGHIKPANIMAIADQIKLSSDGINSMREPGDTPAQPAGVYDPPEAASGVLSPASDIWSLGITLVEVLTQRPPFADDNLKAAPAVPESLPAPFLEIVRRCLLIDPPQRCSIAEIAAQLNPSASPRPVPAVTPPMRAAAPPTASGIDSRTTIPPRPAAPLPARTSAPPPRPPAPPRAAFSGADAARKGMATEGTARKRTGRPHYLIWAIVAAFVLAAILGGARLLNRRESQQTPAASPIARESSTASVPPLRRQPELPQAPENARSHAKTKAPLRSGEAKLPPERSAAQRDSGSSGSTTGSTANSSGLGGKSQPPQTFDAPRGIRSDAAAKTPLGRGVPGEVLQQDLPNVSAKARASIQGRVRVTIKVRVDQSGGVTQALIVSPGPSKYFADLALKSAQRWEFSPAKLENQYVASEWSLRYEFSGSGTKVYPRQTSP